MRVAPDAIITQTNLTGAVTAIQDDPAAADGSWLTAASTSANSILRCSFPTPAANFALSGTQTFRAQVRAKVSSTVLGTPTPTVNIGLRITGGASNLVTSSTTTLSNQNATIITLTWNPASYPTVAADGSNVEIYILGTSDSAGLLGANTGTVEIGAVAWDASGQEQSHQYTASLSDSIGTSETASIAALSHKSDSIAASDSKTTYITKTVESFVTLAETLAKQLAASRTIADSLTAADTFRKAAAAGTSDSITIEETSTKAAAAETYDSIAAEETIAKAASTETSDTITLAEDQSKKAAKETSEQIRVTDQQDKGVFITAADGLLMADEESARTEKGIHDEQPVTEAKQNTIKKHALDLLTIEESTSRRVFLVAVDEARLIDEKSTKAEKEIRDRAIVTEALEKAIRAHAGDSIQLGDQDQGEDIEKLLLDAIAAGDTLKAEQLRGLYLSDSLKLTDSIAKATRRHAQESIFIGDLDHEDIDRILADAIAAGDNIHTQQLKGLFISDSLKLTDNILKAIQLAETDYITTDEGIEQEAHVSLTFYELIVTRDKLVNQTVPDYIQRIYLRGKKDLYIYFRPAQQLSVFLRGQRELTVTIQAKRNLTEQLLGRRELIARLEGKTKMPADRQNFSMVQGDSKIIVITLDEDVTGAAARWEIKKKADYSLPPLVTKTTEDGSIVISGNTITITLVPDDTKTVAGLLYHECEVIDQQGRISTVTRGQVNIDVHAV